MERDGLVTCLIKAARDWKHLPALNLPATLDEHKGWHRLLVSRVFGLFRHVRHVFSRALS